MSWCRKLWKWNTEGGGLVWNDKEGFVFKSWENAAWQTTGGGWQWSSEAGYVYDGESAALKEAWGEDAALKRLRAPTDLDWMRSLGRATGGEYAPRQELHTVSQTPTVIPRDEEGQAPRKRRQYSPSTLARAMASLTLTGDK